MKYSLSIPNFLEKISQFSSVVQSYPTLCDFMDYSTLGLPVHNPLLEFTQTHVHWVSEISSLSHSVVFLYFFALIAEASFLTSPCYSLELCIQMGISFLFSFAFSFYYFLNYFLRSPQTTILPFRVSFSYGWSWSLRPVQCHKPLSIVLQSLYQI